MVPSASVVSSLYPRIWKSAAPGAATNSWVCFINTTFSNIANWYGYLPTGIVIPPSNKSTSLPGCKLTSLPSGLSKIVAHEVKSAIIVLLAELSGAR